MGLGGGRYARRGVEPLAPRNCGRCTERCCKVYGVPARVYHVDLLPTAVSLRILWELPRSIQARGWLGGAAAGPHAAHALAIGAMRFSAVPPWRPGSPAPQARVLLAAAQRKHPEPIVAGGWGVAKSHGP